MKKTKRRKVGERILAAEKRQQKEKRQRKKREKAKKPKIRDIGDLRKLDTPVTLQELSESAHEPNPPFEICCNGTRGRILLVDYSGATVSSPEGKLWISANTKVYPLLPRSRRHDKNVKVNRKR